MCWTAASALVAPRPWCNDALAALLRTRNSRAACRPVGRLAGGCRLACRGRLQSVMTPGGSGVPTSGRRDGGAMGDKPADGAAGGQYVGGDRLAVGPELLERLVPGWSARVHPRLVHPLLEELDHPNLQLKSRPERSERLVERDLEVEDAVPREQIALGARDPAAVPSSSNCSRPEARKAAHISLKNLAWASFALRGCRAAPSSRTPRPSRSPPHFPPAPPRPAPAVARRVVLRADAPSGGSRAGGAGSTYLRDQPASPVARPGARMERGVRPGVLEQRPPPDPHRRAKATRRSLRDLYEARARSAVRWRARRSVRPRAESRGSRKEAHATQ
jgi:hypothetical protein